MGSTDGKKETRTLKVVFTDREILAFAKGAAEAQRALHEVEEARKASQADFKSRAAALTAEVTLLSRRIRDGHEWQDVECEVSYDWVIGQKFITRLDTGETFSEGITQAERQQRIPTT